MKLFTFVLVLSFTLPSFASNIDVWTLQKSKSSIDDNLIPGKWNLVAVWALDCIACEAQKPKLSSFHRRFDHLNVLGVSIDGKSQIKGVIDRLESKPVSFDNLVVEYDQFASAFSLEFGTSFLATPTYLLYSPVGDLEGVHIGPISFSELKKIIEPRKSTVSTDIMR